MMDLIGVAGLVGHHPVGEGSLVPFPVRGHMPGLWVQSPVGGQFAYEGQLMFLSHIDVSLPFSPCLLYTSDAADEHRDV